MEIIFVIFIYIFLCIPIGIIFISLFIPEKILTKIEKKICKKHQGYWAEEHDV